VTGLYLFINFFNHQFNNIFTYTTPWKCVGGCGAGGSGGTTGATAKWIGKGVSGGLLDVQLMYSNTSTRKSISKALETRLSIKPTYTSTLALSVPFYSKIGSMQTSTASDEVTGIINNGIGDIRVDFINNFGLSGEFSYDFTLSIPTGDFSTSIGANNKKRYLPTNLMLGSGVYSLSLDLGYTKDFGDDALILFDLSYSHPFALNFFGKNQFISSENDKYNSLNDTAIYNQLSSADKKRFEYYFKPYGENDLGAYIPPSVMLSGFYAYKGFENFVHSFGAMFSFPLGVAWIPNFDCKTYDPKPDPDHFAWNLTLCYGLEVSNRNFPVFLALYIPIHDKSASASNTTIIDEYDTKPMAKWNMPDFNDILHRWSIFAGIKMSLF
jgi:hypothetical protein